MGILCVFCVYDTIGNRCFEKTSFPKINAVGTLASLYIKKTDPISVLHVAVGVLVRMCTGTCTVSHAPSLLGIVLNLAEIRALGIMFDQ